MGAMKQWCYGLLVGGLFSLYYPSAFACTDFRIQAKDGTVLITRSMEFAEDLNSNIRTMPRATSFSARNLSWKNRYGYIFADGLNMPIANV